MFISKSFFVLKKAKLSAHFFTKAFLSASVFSLCSFALHAAGKAVQPKKSTAKSAPASAAVQEKMAAEIAGEKITLESILEEMNAQRPGIVDLRSTNPDQFEALYKYYLMQYVSRKVLLNEAMSQKEKLESDPKVKKQLGRALNDILLAAMISRHVEGKVTPEAIRTAYNKKSLEAVKLAIIVTEDEATAKGVIKSFKMSYSRGAGSSEPSNAFSDLAKKHSVEKETAKQGGMMPEALTIALPAPLKEQIVKMEVGSISEKPLPIQKRWVVIRLVERKEKAPFDTAQAYLREDLSKKALMELMVASQKKQSVKVYDLKGAEISTQIPSAA